MFQFHRTTVGKYLSLRGIDTSATLTPKDLTRALHLYEQVWTLVQLAREFNVHKRTMRKRLTELDVVIRVGGRAHWTTRSSESWMPDPKIGG